MSKLTRTFFLPQELRWSTRGEKCEVETRRNNPPVPPKKLHFLWREKPLICWVCKLNFSLSGLNQALADNLFACMTLPRSMLSPPHFIIGHDFSLLSPTLFPVILKFKNGANRFHMAVCVVFRFFFTNISIPTNLRTCLVYKVLLCFANDNAISWRLSLKLCLLCSWKDAENFSPLKQSTEKQKLTFRMTFSGKKQVLHPELTFFAQRR